MLDPLQFYCRVLCNGMKTRFRMVMIAHPGPGIGFHKRFMWQIIIPPTAEEAKVFQNLKKAFGSAPVLAHWALDLPMMVETDASDCAIVGILSVAFYSHTLQSAEWNYDMHDKELLAIFEAFKSWRHFLEGLAAAIDTVMDHKNLEYFTSTKKLTR